MTLQRIESLAIPSDERVAEVLSGAISFNTRRSYRAQWELWVSWVLQHGLDALPADPQAVMRYLIARGDTGVSRSTLKMAVCAIAAVHKTVGLPNPCAHAGVREALNSMARDRAVDPPRQAMALTDEALAAIQATAPNPRYSRFGRQETAEEAQRRGQLDIALCMMLRDAGLRRSEASELRWGDCQPWDDGSGRVTVRKSKTDQFGETAVVAIPQRTRLALESIMPNDVDPEHLVFGLSACQISRRVAAAALAAHLGEGYTGHSGRVGLARKMTSRGAPTTVTMQQGRWNSPRMVARYTRGETAAAALHYL